MNIFDYFHSRDIANYCKSIGHIFNSIEMAYIVDMSDKTIKEKNLAFQEIIDTCPDMQFHESVDFKVKTSIHAYLRALIDYRKALLKAFEDPSNTTKVYYTIDIYSASVMGFDENLYKKLAFSNIEELLIFIRPYMARYNLKKIGIKRGMTKKHSDFVIVHYNYNGEATCIFDKHYLNKKYELAKIIPEGPGALHTLFIHIPVPFNEGDIVSSTYDCFPCVLKVLPHFAKEYAKLESGAKYKGYIFEDRPDFAVYYFLNQNGVLQDSFPCSHNIKSPYANGFGCDVMKLKYYREPLKPKEKILMDLSNYIKENGPPNVSQWLSKVDKNL